MYAVRSGARSGAVVALALILSLAACDGPREGSGRTSVTDSAGVELVSNGGRGLWEGPSPWHFVEELRIGGMDRASGEASADHVLLGAVAGLDVDRDGNVYVADQQAQEVMVFAPDGHPVRTIGKPGSGPGELGQGIRGVFVRGGEIWVPDVGNLRIDRFDVQGKTLGSLPIDLTHGMPVRWERLNDRVVAEIRTLPIPGMIDNPEGDPILAFDPDGQDTVVVLAKGATVGFQGGQPRVTLFESEPVWDATSDGRLLTGTNTDYRVEVRDSTGHLLRVLGKPFAKREVTKADQKKILAAYRETMSAQGMPVQSLDQLMGMVGFADSYPAMDRVMAGPHGTVWVQHVLTAADVSGQSDELDLQAMNSDDWDVFDGKGQYLGVTTLPKRFSPRLVRGDTFWGTQLDSLDVPSVVRYRLVEGS